LPSLVAIIGAGEIGGAVARALASRTRVGLIRLIDENESVAAGKALDLMQARPMARSDTRIEGAADVIAAAGAAAIVLADRAATSSEWSGEAGLAQLRRLAAGGGLDSSVLICAGAGHRDLMQQALDELGLSRRRLIGSAPEAMAATARALAATEARTSAQQVSLAVLGRPPDKMVIPWSEASIGGHSVASLLSAPQLNRVERRLKGVWPPGPNALGTAAALCCEAVAAGSRRIFSAFVSLDRDNGTRAPVCAWPVSLGAAGLERVTTPALSVRDQMVVDEVLR
jgi:malate/lactate dehydrogenase